MQHSKEGDLFRVLEIGGRTIELRYGYYDPALERDNIDPTPIYPDFKRHPLYTDSGIPFVTADQDVCEHFDPKPKISGEGWCNDCKHLEKHEEFIGLCKCPLRKRNGT